MKNLSNTTAVSPIAEEKVRQGASKQPAYTTFEVFVICLLMIIFAVGSSLIP